MKLLLIDKIQSAIKSTNNEDINFLLSKPQIESTISMLQLMYNNLVNDTDSDISNEINKILHWSVDSWDWDNLFTKEIWSIIDDYEKVHKKQ